MTEPLRLNHLYRVVDAETFAAARESTWLREVFAPSELRTTQRPDWSYTGLYWYGTSTYIELFEAGEQGAAGTTGVAFGVETPGASAAVAAAWRHEFGQAEHRVVVRPVTAGPGTPASDDANTSFAAPDSSPWFHIAHAVPDRREQLHLWAMEYHADFLSAWHGTLTSARGITRAEVLERYARVSGGPADPLLDDVTAVSLALTATERAFLDRHVTAFDAQIRDVGGDATYIEGDGITIGTAAASESRRGVQDVVCRLRRPAGRETITIGRSTISVAGDRLVWRFRE